MTIAVQASDIPLQRAANVSNKKLYVLSYVENLSSMSRVAAQHSPWFWLRISPVCSLVFFLHNKDMFCYLSSLLADSAHFQLELISRVSTALLLVKLVVIKNVQHVVSCPCLQPLCFSLILVQPQNTSSII